MSQKQNNVSTYKYYKSGSKTSRPMTKKKIIDTKINKPDIDTDIINETLNKNKINTDNLAFNTYQKSYIEAKEFLKKNNIMISTITLDCKLGTLIDVDVFAKNVTLKHNKIISVKFGNRNDSATNRTIVAPKTNKKPSLINFYNQVTILMKPTNNPERNYINIKVFKNGSLQMTGCKDMEDFNNVTVTLIKILKKGKDCEIKGKTVHLNYIEDAEKIGIFDVKIRMINSNFKLDYKVDRKKLAKILKKHHGVNSRDKEIGYVECKYQPTGGHSCVNIKYNNDNNKTSVFVFQTGAIIITGAKNLNHIISAYHFIHKILTRYYEKIKILPLEQNLVQLEIEKYFRNKPRTMQLVDVV
ncbi:TATA-box-binding protein-like protein [Cotonvirus japonicus]|uniref:TATA-box-binding protein-like protein n=1 Tax=Cotonvirus japonicus TaxID=2811091 RepID=A0ABM7NSE8_9VIRU|nr:TATA-box-binding protein-like protein [Cotonvirus japonicus]BCS83088.1 TATA-box-binding protein-like protein [Cotonvirus japonicus]